MGRLAPLAGSDMLDSMSEATTEPDATDPADTWDPIRDRWNLDHEGLVSDDEIKRFKNTIDNYVGGLRTDANDPVIKRIGTNLGKVKEIFRVFPVDDRGNHEVIYKDDKDRLQTALINLASGGVIISDGW